jgi:hypothetical protein
MRRRCSSNPRPAMTSHLTRLCVVICFSIGLALLGAAQTTHAGDMKLDAQLLWGTDDSKPPEGKHYTPVEPALKKKLKELPLKWNNYFEVRKKSIEVAPGAVKREAMSDKCELEISNLGKDKVEVRLFGKGKQVMNRKQALPKGEILVLGGNAPNSTAWLVAVRRLQ